jgi:parallel beta-helix repeat protein
MPLGALRKLFFIRLWWPRRDPRRARLYRRRPWVELLEDRRVMATLTVCAGTGFSTIGAAVASANAGDTISVCAGTYVEQVVIPAGKDNLTLVSQQQGAAVIRAPANMTSPKAIVDVHGAHNVTISGFTISGPGVIPGAGDTLEYGVRVDSGGSATIQNNHITHIRDNPLQGVQSGVGILVGRANPADSTTGTATITNNVIDDYQKAGIVVANNGSQATISSNTITGAGQISKLAQYGIQVSSGAKADINGNTISQNAYMPPDNYAAGILLANTSGVTVRNNVLHDNLDGILLDHATKSTLTGNQLNANLEGTVLQVSSGNTLRQNVFTANQDGLALVSSNNNTMDRNRISGSAQSGLILFGSSGNTISGNTTTGNNFGLVFDVDSGNNRVVGNVARNNSTADLFDNSGNGHGTRNSYSSNSIGTTQPTRISRAAARRHHRRARRVHLARGHGA